MLRGIRKEDIWDFLGKMYWKRVDFTRKDDVFSQKTCNYCHEVGISNTIAWIRGYNEKYPQPPCSILQV
jgi:hypothetical protein